jgi:hypothetical protein
VNAIKLLNRKLAFAWQNNIMLDFDQYNKSRHFQARTSDKFYCMISGYSKTFTRALEISMKNEAIK